MLVQDVIDRARTVLIGFDTKFILDAQLFRELTDEQETLLERTVEGPNQSFALPGDQSDIVALTPYQAAYTLPADLWRIRRVELVRSVGDPVDVQLVAASWRHGVPPTWPSAFVTGPYGAHELVLLDGVYDGQLTSRTYGWEAASIANVHSITEPVAITAVGQTMDAPDAARSYLAHWLAVYMATRGHVSDSEVKQIRDRRDAELQSYLQTVAGFPGRRQYSDA
ncbi:MAG: hypothetical protein R3190_14070 [Thermoanaerobaculia bacterium]|nr:hypothetical protein [Thermoanaerobaculia bacterium]